MSSSTLNLGGTAATNTNNNNGADTINNELIKPYIAPLSIGDTCMILWRDGSTQLLSKIVECKRNPNVKELVKTLPPLPPPSPSVVVDDDATKSVMGEAIVREEVQLPPEENTAIATATADATVGGEPALKRSKPNDEAAVIDSSDATDIATEGGASTLTKQGELKSSGSNQPSKLPSSSTSSSENNKSKDLKEGGAGEEQKPSAYDYIYYIHYEEHDRRLDEWVPLSRFDLSTLHRIPPPEDDNVNGDLLGLTAPRSTRRASVEGKKTNSRSGRGRGRRPSSQAVANADGTTTSSGGGGGGSGADGTSNTDSLLRGGNWHGNSGNPDLAELEAEHHEITKVKNITQIVMGKHLVEAWYYSPFPPPYHEVETLYICEFCLKYMRKPHYFLKHCAECSHKSPPGNEIYREGKLSVYELDGRNHRVYCQNLCLLAKLFLDHKTLYYDVDPFYFYVITEVDDEGAHIVGYFSKEKVSAEDYNLACILTFPQYQKCGYGKFIISLSYELSKREGKPGSPEKPLSDLGKISYRSYWTHVLLTLFSEQGGEENMQIKDISLMTGIKMEDIISTLQSLNMIRFWKGQHVVFVMQDFVKKYMAQKKKIRLCDGKCLTWTPHAERKKGGVGGSSD